MREKEPKRSRRDSDFTAEETFNIVTDTVTGPNLRWKDNLYQGLIVLGCIPIGAGIGALLTSERGPGAVLGAIIGPVVGLLLSGLIIGILRTRRHLRGKHD